MVSLTSKQWLIDFQAIGPRVWFDEYVLIKPNSASSSRCFSQYGTNQSMGGTVQNNVLSGAFAFGMVSLQARSQHPADFQQAVSSAKNFVIQNNSFSTNVSFVCLPPFYHLSVAEHGSIPQSGTYGPNCTGARNTPNPPVPLILETSSTTNLTISVPANSAPFQGAFTNGTAFGLTCFLPLGTNLSAWPYGGGQSYSTNSASSTIGGASSSTSRSTSPSATSGLSTASPRTSGKSGAARWQVGGSHKGVIYGTMVIAVLWGLRTISL